MQSTTCESSSLLGHAGVRPKYGSVVAAAAKGPSTSVEATSIQAVSERGHSAADVSTMRKASSYSVELVGVNRRPSRGTPNETPPPQGCCCFTSQCCTAEKCQKAVRRRLPIVSWLPKYPVKSWLPCDIIAGLTVALTAIPQGLAYATVADLPPQYGLYSSMMGPLIYVLLGSTRIMTIGPTALVSLITYTYAAGKPPEYAVFLAFITGIVTTVAGIFNLGFLVDFISVPVTEAFISASAITIASTQVKGLLGQNFHADGFVNSWKGVIENIHDVRVGDICLSIFCIVFLLFFRSIKDVCMCCLREKKAPTPPLPGEEGEPVEQPVPVVPVERTCRMKVHMLQLAWFLSTARNALVVIICAVTAYIFSVSWNETPFLLTGPIQAGFPDFEWPPISMVQNNVTVNFWQMCSEAGSAFGIIPLLAVMEHVAIAKAFAEGKSVDASQEMMALGLANFLGAFVSSMPVTGSFTRSCVNHASGVRSPLGGLFTAVVIFLSLAFLTPSFYFIPKASLSAVIVCAVLFMIDYKLPLDLWRANKVELVPAAITFLICLIFGSQYGMLTGITVSLLIILYHVARPKVNVTLETSETGSPYVLVRPDRSVLFPSVNYVRNTMGKAAAREGNATLPVVLDCSYMQDADFTTAQGLRELWHDLTRSGQSAYVVRAKDDILCVLRNGRPAGNLPFVPTDDELYRLLQNPNGDDEEPELVSVRHLHTSDDLQLTGENDNESKRYSYGEDSAISSEHADAHIVSTHSIPSVTFNIPDEQR